MVNQSELENAKCFSDEEEYNKSKSYLEAAKENLSDTNNNQTFPIWPILEQGIVVNEVVPTTESPTALEVVPNSESPVTN